MSNKLNLLIVEDNIDRINWFQKEFCDCRIIFAKTAKQGIRAINSEVFSTILLDHDLGDRVFVPSSDSNTGYQVALAIPNSINKDTPVIVHSWNPVGTFRILNVLPNAKRQIFGSFSRSILK